MQELSTKAFDYQKAFVEQLAKSLLTKYDEQKRPVIRQVPDVAKVKKELMTAITKKQAARAAAAIAAVRPGSVAFKDKH